MKKILVIDYDQSALASLQGILTKEGYQVVTAGDGQAGWDKYNKESPDLVLMEAMLPKVHGFELCQRITSERNSQAPVFIMTGVYKDRVYRTEALRTYGASEYFEKPLKMAELLASVEAVLGKPALKPAPAEPAPVKPAKEIRPEPALVDPRKIEKPKPAEHEIDWSADLDKMRREIPKTRIPGPAHLEPSIETRLESIADELFKKPIVEPAPQPKPVGQEKQPGTGEYKGNGHENIDIDKFLKSALADLDFGQEKVRLPKTAPLPPAPPAEKSHPTPPPTVAFKPMPTPPPPPVVEKKAGEQPRSVPAPHPTGVFSQPAEPVPSVTLTPGDPGSDASPFFTPPKPKPEKPRDFASVPRPAKPVERPKVPAPAPAPKPPKAEEKKAEPAKREMKVREAAAITSSQIFSDVAETKDKKGFPPLVAVGVGIAVVAALGFFILKPKKPAATSADALKSRHTVAQPAVTEKPAEEVPPPEAKPAAAKPRVETQTRVADIGPSSEEAILIPVAPSSLPPALEKQAGGGDNKSQGAAESKPVQADPPPIKTEENPPQGTVSEAGSSANPGTSAETPVAPQVNEGDLVDLASVSEQPKALKTVDPVYPQLAQRLGVKGSITVNALIDEKGNVIDTGILKGIQDDRGLGKAAETAIKKWKFQPAKKGGVNVKVWKSFVIVFKTDKNSANMIQ